MSGLVHVVNRSGHRAEYQDLFASKFDLAPVSGRISWGSLQRFLKADQMLFATIDDDLLGFFLTAVLRAMLGKRTAGLYLRPHSCFERGWKARFKYLAFQLLTRNSCVTTLSILPTELLPKQVAVVDGWIHDPQLWDLLGCPVIADSDMEILLHNTAGTRPVLALLGHVAPAKGLPLLLAMIECCPELSKQFCIVVAGELSENFILGAERLKHLGAVVWPRRLSEAEMAAVYEVALFLWACYDPSYDQASGIFGRAVQRGKIAIVREGAMLDRYASMLGHRVISLPYNAADAVIVLSEAQMLSSISTVDVKELYQMSTEVVWRALR